MFYLVILYFFGLLAQRSYAGCSQKNLDSRLIPNVFEKGGRSFLPPRLEYEVSANNFQKDFMNITRTYGDKVLANLYSQAAKRGQELIDDVESASEQLQLVIESGGKSPDRKDVESAMTALTNQLKRFLKLKPGHTAVKHAGQLWYKVQVLITPPEKNLS